MGNSEYVGGGGGTTVQGNRRNLFPPTARRLSVTEYARNFCKLIRFSIGLLRIRGIKTHTFFSKPTQRVVPRPLTEGPLPFHSYYVQQHNPLATYSLLGAAATGICFGRTKIVWVGNSEYGVGGTPLPGNRRDLAVRPRARPGSSGSNRRDLAVRPHHGGPFCRFSF